jgi:chemotaxis protein histidine kinase CheA
MSLTPANTGSNESFDPLELDRYNELHGATRSLVEVTADAREMTETLEAGVTNLRTEVAQHANLNKELQYQVVATRLAPVNVLSARLVRNVRQTCQQTGKQAELVISGGEIQVDGDVLNKLADPLLHLLRNAVDHGIELPEDRAATGKPITGTINLDFSRQGLGIVVTIRDDGKGLDYERIRAKAIDRELIRADQQLTYPELARLVLLPGFSTRDQVSEISGRGNGCGCHPLGEHQGNCRAQFRARTGLRSCTALPGIAGHPAHLAGGSSKTNLCSPHPLYQRSLSWRARPGKTDTSRRAEWIRRRRLAFHHP